MATVSTDPDDSGSLSRDGLSNYKTLPMRTEQALPRQSAWRFLKFPLLPAEIQIMIWKEALKTVMIKQPRLIPAGTLLPPSQETHAVVRILAQTCGASRDLALPYLAQCRQHELLHHLVIPRQTPDRVAGPPPPGTNNLTVAGLMFLGAPGAPGAGVQPFPALAPDAHWQQLDDDPEDEAGTSGGLQIPITNPIENHIHVDDDYFLFFQDTYKWMCESAGGNQNILTRARHIAAPISTWYSFFRSHPFGGEPNQDWLITNATSVLFLLPTDMKLLWTEVYDSGLNQEIMDENARWSQAVEVPYELLRFWTDEEMRLFHQSYSWRSRYHDKNGYVMNVPGPSHTTPSSLELLLSRSLNLSSTLADNPFDQWRESHFLFEMWHCWQIMFPAHDKKIPVRFAHLKGIDMYDFLDERRGRKPSRSVLKWTDYIPRFSADEVRRQCVKRRLKYPDKSKSALYPAETLK